MNIKDKHIVIIGAVRSGLAAAKLVKKLGGIPFVSDMGDEAKLSESKKFLVEENIDHEFSGHSEKIFETDLIVTSPGVPSDSEALKKAAEKNIRVISEVEFAAQFCEGKIIAVTGSNGKTTTTSLIAHVLNESGKVCYAAGNIGRAFSDIAAEVKKDEFVALETSSFQLDFIDEFKPEFALILNITPDHLDRYENKFQNYIDSKIKIFENQDSNDKLIINADDNVIAKNISEVKSDLYQFSTNRKVKKGAFLFEDGLYFVEKNNEEKICSVTDLSLKGEHNIYNVLSVIIIAKLLEIENEKIKKSFGTFPGVEHRLEFVRELNGVEYINDSKATNVDSVRYALRSFDKPIYLILGGKDKGNDYNEIREPVLKNVTKIYAVGSSSKKIYDFFNGIVKVEIFDTIEDAVKSAKNDAPEGSVVLLSPACASFDMFKSYEHRGKVYKEVVNKL